jgi:uncharacterized protein YuzB (UPF0349 family)
MCANMQGEMLHDTYCVTYCDVCWNSLHAFAGHGCTGMQGDVAGVCCLIYKYLWPPPTALLIVD